VYRIAEKGARNPYNLCLKITKNWNKNIVSKVKIYKSKIFMSGKAEGPGGQRRLSVRAIFGQDNRASIGVKHWVRLVVLLALLQHRLRMY